MRLERNSGRYAAGYFWDGSMQTYFVYIVASRSRNLYTGVTNDLRRRILQHKQGLVPGFTTRYRIQRLVYYEQFGAYLLLLPVRSK